MNRFSHVKFILIPGGLRNKKGGQAGWTVNTTSGQRVGVYATQGEALKAIKALS